MPGARYDDITLNADIFGTVDFEESSGKPETHVVCCLTSRCLLIVSLLTKEFILRDLRDGYSRSTEVTRAGVGKTVGC